MSILPKVIHTLRIGNDVTNSFIALKEAWENWYKYINLEDENRLKYSHTALNSVRDVLHDQPLIHTLLSSVKAPQEQVVGSSIQLEYELEDPNGAYTTPYKTETVREGLDARIKSRIKFTQNTLIHDLWFKHENLRRAFSLTWLKFKLEDLAQRPDDFTITVPNALKHSSTFISKGPVAYKGSNLLNMHNGNFIELSSTVTYDETTTLPILPPDHSHILLPCIAISKNNLIAIDGLRLLNDVLAVDKQVVPVSFIDEESADEFYCFPIDYIQVRRVFQQIQIKESDGIGPRDVENLFKTEDARRVLLAGNPRLASMVNRKHNGEEPFRMGRIRENLYMSHTLELDSNRVGGGNSLSLPYEKACVWVRLEVVDREDHMNYNLINDDMLLGKAPFKRGTYALVFRDASIDEYTLILIIVHILEDIGVNGTNFATRQRSHPIEVLERNKVKAMLDKNPKMGLAQLAEDVVPASMRPKWTSKRKGEEAPFVGPLFVWIKSLTMHTPLAILGSYEMNPPLLSVAQHVPSIVYLEVITSSRDGYISNVSLIDRNGGAFQRDVQSSVAVSIFKPVPLGLYTTEIVKTVDMFFNVQEEKVDIQEFAYIPSSISVLEDGTIPNLAEISGRIFQYLYLSMGNEKRMIFSELDSIVPEMIGNVLRHQTRNAFPITSVPVSNTSDLKEDVNVPEFHISLSGILEYGARIKDVTELITNRTSVFDKLMASSTMTTVFESGFRSITRNLHGRVDTAFVNASNAYQTSGMAADALRQKRKALWLYYAIWKVLVGMREMTNSPTPVVETNVLSNTARKIIEEHSQSALSDKLAQVVNAEGRFLMLKDLAAEIAYEVYGQIFTPADISYIQPRPLVIDMSEVENTYPGTAIAQTIIANNKSLNAVQSLTLSLKLHNMLVRTFFPFLGNYSEAIYLDHIATGARFGNRQQFVITTTDLEAKYTPGFQLHTLLMNKFLFVKLIQHLVHKDMSSIQIVGNTTRINNTTILSDLYEHLETRNLDPLWDVDGTEAATRRIDKKPGFLYLISYDIMEKLLSNRATIVSSISSLFQSFVSTNKIFHIRERKNVTDLISGKLFDPHSTYLGQVSWYVHGPETLKPPSGKSYETFLTRENQVRILFGEICRGSLTYGNGQTKNVPLVAILSRHLYQYQTRMYDQRRRYDLENVHLAKPWSSEVVSKNILAQFFTLLTTLGRGAGPTLFQVLGYNYVHACLNTTANRIQLYGTSPDITYMPIYRVRVRSNVAGFPIPNPIGNKTLKRIKAIRLLSTFYLNFITMFSSHRNGQPNDVFEIIFQIYNSDAQIGLERFGRKYLKWFVPYMSSSLCMRLLWNVILSRIGTVLNSNHHRSSALGKSFPVKLVNLWRELDGSRTYDDVIDRIEPFLKVHPSPLYDHWKRYHYFLDNSIDLSWTFDGLLPESWLPDHNHKVTSRVMNMLHVYTLIISGDERSEISSAFYSSTGERIPFKRRTRIEVKYPNGYYSDNGKRLPPVFHAVRDLLTVLSSPDCYFIDYYFLDYSHDPTNQLHQLRVYIHFKNEYNSDGTNLSGTSSLDVEHEGEYTRTNPITRLSFTNLINLSTNWNIADEKELKVKGTNYEYLQWHRYLSTASYDDLINHFLPEVRQWATTRGSNMEPRMRNSLESVLNHLFGTSDLSKSGAFSRLGTKETIMVDYVPPGVESFVDPRMRTYPNYVQGPMRRDNPLVVDKRLGGTLKAYPQFAASGVKDLVPFSPNQERYMNLIVKNVSGASDLGLLLSGAWKEVVGVVLPSRKAFYKYLTYPSSVINFNLLPCERDSFSTLRRHTWAAYLNYVKNEWNTYLHQLGLGSPLVWKMRFRIGTLLHNTARPILYMPTPIRPRVPKYPNLLAGEMGTVVIDQHLNLMERILYHIFNTWLVNYEKFWCGVIVPELVKISQEGIREIDLEKGE